MKRFLPLVLSVVSVAQAEQPRAATAPTRDATTPQQMQERHRLALEQQAARSTPVVVPAPPQKLSLLANSDILCQAGMATLVPKRSILHLPEAMQSRLGMKDGAQIENWSTFLAANRGWITLVEVSGKQAEGKEPLSEETIKSFEESSNLIVATFRGCPISVMPLKTPAEGQVPAAAPASTTPSTSTKSSQ